MKNNACKFTIGIWFINGKNGGIRKQFDENIENDCSDRSSISGCNTTCCNVCVSLFQYSFLVYKFFYKRKF